MSQPASEGDEPLGKLLYSMHRVACRAAQIEGLLCGRPTGWLGSILLKNSLKRLHRVAAVPCPVTRWDSGARARVAPNVSANRTHRFSFDPRSLSARRADHLPTF